MTCRGDCRRSNGHRSLLEIPHGHRQLLDHQLHSLRLANQGPEFLRRWRPPTSDGDLYLLLDGSRHRSLVACQGLRHAVHLQGPGQRVGQRVGWRGVAGRGHHFVKVQLGGLVHRRLDRLGQMRRQHQRLRGARRGDQRGRSREGYLLVLSRDDVALAVPRRDRLPFDLHNLPCNGDTLQQGRRTAGTQAGRRQAGTHARTQSQLRTHAHTHSPMRCPS